MTVVRHTAPPTTTITADEGVCAPQEDSHLLCPAIASHPAVRGARVLDLCTGSGIAAITAAQHGAREVLAYDICARAVRCAAANAVRNGVVVDVRCGTIFDAQSEARSVGRFDVLLCNPPYVPSPGDPEGTGLHRAWDGGKNGRNVLDLLCASAFDLLTDSGIVIFVQSHFSGTEQSLLQLRVSGLDADIVRRRTIEFGPVMTTRAAWLEGAGLIDTGCHTEELIVAEGLRRTIG